MSDNILIYVNKVFRMGMQYYANEECLSCSKGVINGKESNLIFMNTRTQSSLKNSFTFFYFALKEIKKVSDKGNSR
jgi:hypothetical protein